MLDLLIIVGVGLTQLILTVYGIYISVAEFKKRHAVAFFVIGAVGIGLTVWGGKRSMNAQDALQAKIDKIEQNTEHAVPVNVTVPAPIVKIPGASKHTHVEYMSAEEALSAVHLSSLYPLHEGQKPSLALVFRNMGDYAVQHPNDAGQALLLPTKHLDLAFKSLHKKLVFHGEGGTIPAHSPNAAYHTVEGPELTAPKLAQLKAQDLALCNVGAVKWADETGNYETTVFQCLMSESPTAGGFNWHAMKENNEEKRLPFGVN